MSPSDPAPRLPVLAAGLASFLTLGVIQAMYGPAFPLFQERFGVDTAGVGVIASAHFLGSASAPPLVGVLLAWVSLRRIVVAGLVLLALGVTGVALAPSWPLAVACALLGGFGLGNVSAGLNSAYGSLGTRHANLVNACFGLGSMLAPLLVAGLGRTAALPVAALPFLAVAVLGAAALVVIRVWNVPAIQARPEVEAQRPSVGLFALFAALLFMYVFLEVGYGAWAARYLEALGVGGAALIVSGYWLAMTAGRLLAGVVGGRWQPGTLVLGSAGLALGFTALLFVKPLAALACLGAGLALAPVFGTTLAWMTASLPVRWVPPLLVAGSVGGAAAPWLVGQLVARFGAGAVPVAFLGGAAALLGLALLTRAWTRPAQPA
ncbi:MFS transporter [Deinococcus ficus]|nr:MFS transporter [Deinococcus ficus]